MIVCGCAGGSSGSRAETARDRVEAARELHAAADAAYQAGDQETWAESLDQSLGAYRDAARLYREAGFAESADTAKLQEYAEVLVESEDYDLAEEIYSRCIALNSGNPQWYLARGSVRLKLNDDKQPAAIQDFLQVLDRVESGDVFLEAAERLASVYWDAQQFALARSYCLRADEESEVTSTRCMAVLAATDIREGRVVAAFERVRSSTAGSSGDLALIREYLARGIEDFRLRKLTINDEPEAHYAFGQLLLISGRGGEALQAASRAAQLAAGRPDVLNFAASLEAQAGGRDRAIGLFEQSLDTDPEQPAVREALQQLRAADRAQ